MDTINFITNYIRVWVELKNHFTSKKMLLETQVIQTTITQTLKDFILVLNIIKILSPGLTE